ncbi:MAG TPA: Hpt domain-containing protein [Candidatus Binatia bacterium]|nr:Hpt domain-containing protein [Candidatus Binatia bacterium]
MAESVIEAQIKFKAKEWVDEYGEDFLIELIDVYLKDTPNRVMRLRQALDGGDSEAFVREAHTLKSSSASVGAMGLSKGLNLSRCAAMAASLPSRLPSDRSKRRAG